MRIGELAARTGVSVRALRYYEEHGLLTPQRSPRGQRMFTEGAVARVRLLRSLYHAGLSSSIIASLLPCVDAPGEDISRETLQVLYAERDRLTGQLADLVMTRDHLTAVIGAAADFADQAYGRARSA